MEDRTRPSAIVRAGIDTEAVTVADLTVAELLTVCIERTGDERAGANDTGAYAAREFSIAITHMEDAITRHNKGVYRLKDTFAITDAERSLPDDELDRIQRPLQRISGERQPVRAPRADAVYDGAGVNLLHEGLVWIAENGLHRGDGPPPHDGCDPCFARSTLERAKL